MLLLRAHKTALIKGLSDRYQTYSNMEDPLPCLRLITLNTVGLCLNGICLNLICTLLLLNSLGLL